ncbi:hypothetical protein AKJ36_02035 [candidate division MSBL1 archaeon SCGC-AAA259I07]|uniref:Uncharacterized protein n=1 Tax=candidate division MSBL1 archaeon SCGC-AAA259I07 TaxID=1698266 RepID=A0A133UKX1_9EURY|nr:hypothetical protein AKJ36_02035 [candidate division MSBL1 archaeon SCGC-AAA259I07]
MPSYGRKIPVVSSESNRSIILEEPSSFFRNVSSPKKCAEFSNTLLPEKSNSETFKGLKNKAEYPLYKHMSVVSLLMREKGNTLSEIPCLFLKNGVDVDYL